MKSSRLLSLQALLALSAVVFLTGAKGQGCGGDVDPTPLPVDPEPACAAGWHTTTVCGGGDVLLDRTDGNDGSDIAIGEPPPPSSCHNECVPDSGCPEGQAQAWVCSGGGSVGTGIAIDENGDQAGCIHDEPTCELVCQPASCGQGQHIEWSCGGSSGGGSVGTSSGSAGSEESDSSFAPDEPTQPPSECVMFCADDSSCPPGTEEQTICSQSDCGPDADCELREPVCFTECVGFEPPSPDAPQAEPGGF